MPLYRDEAGLVFEADERFAQAMGYSPVSPSEESDIYAQRGLEARGEERGALGTVTAALSGVASGMTLGGTDVLLGEGLSEGERQALLAEIEAHPYARGGGEIAGTVASSFAVPGSALARTPAGYLSSVAAREVEEGLVRGGLRGTAKALGAMGAEGAAQAAGQYIGHTSLADTEITAEGLAGASGVGFAFGAVGGGAALGVAKGTMAARRMFSRVMDGQNAAKAAESSWSLASQEALEADIATAQTAQARLDEITAAKMEALKYRNEARNIARGEQIRAQAVPDQGTAIPTSGIDEAIGPEPLAKHGPALRSKWASEASGAVDVAADTATSAERMSWREFTKGKMGEYMKSEGGHAGAMDRLAREWKDYKAGASVAAKPAARVSTGSRAAALDYASTALADVTPAQGGMPTSVFKQPEPIVFDRRAADAFDNTLPRHEGPEPLVDVGPQPQGQVTSVRAPTTKKIPRPEAVEPSAAPTDLEAQLAAMKKRVDEGEDILKPRTADEALADMREKRTGELLSGPIAKEEAKLVEALDEYKAARKEFEQVMAGGAPDATAVAAPGNRKAVEILDQAHEEALLRAQAAIDPREAGRALQEAEHYEQLLEHLAPIERRLPYAEGPSSLDDSLASLPSPRVQSDKGVFGGVGDFMNELHSNAAVVSRYEKASAKLADVVGDDAHPVTQAMRKASKKAEGDAERKVFDRTARAVDDAETFGPAAMSSKERVRYAKERQLEAQRGLDNLNVQEKEARGAVAKAQQKAREGEKAKKAALRADAKAGAATGSKATEALGAWEILDLPGMPTVSDLPVVGPLLGAYLKYRTLKAAMSRRMGRVPASGNARAAALAARTKDRIARAVDRSLGVMERGATRVSRKGAPVAGVLSSRIYDDGEPEPKKGAPITELAAARVRELAAYVHTPGAIENDVRRQLLGVTDPDLIAATEKHRRAAMEWLLANAPKGPEQGIIQTVKWTPSPAESMSFARRLEAVGDPAGVYERLADQQAMISLEAAEALRAVYPQLFLQAQKRVLERVTEAPKAVPYRQRVQMSLLYKLPLDAALEPDNLKITQSVYERKPVLPPGLPGPGGAPAAPPTPSVAQPTNVTALYQRAFDR